MDDQGENNAVLFSDSASNIQQLVAIRAAGVGIVNMMEDPETDLTLVLIGGVSVLEFRYRELVESDVMGNATDSSTKSLMHQIQRRIPNKLACDKNRPNCGQCIEIAGKSSFNSATSKVTIDSPLSPDSSYSEPQSKQSTVENLVYTFTEKGYFNAMRKQLYKQFNKYISHKIDSAESLLQPAKATLVSSLEKFVDQETNRTPSLLSKDPRIAGVLIEGAADQSDIYNDLREILDTMIDEMFISRDYFKILQSVAIVMLDDFV
ncbi:hypothetical protein K469DRAFT_692177 [Zopfia rhizophila CBS 207.26]|uniref:BOD1/SHG1 domain-containing protein n=1 Tax=Zopfia rhizophila CBS 207.26 TaxID=1314779 RepID=A0A6A6DSE8_9PEZI|nr:hypothetical protein K469DRAFT_692177 [Zopfia rhizophila CBS 207.26]